MERFVNFFRVRKVFFVWFVLLGLSIAGIVFCSGLPGDMWFYGALAVLATIGCGIGSCFGLWVASAQLAVRRKLSTPEQMTPKQRVRHLRKKRVDACLTYYGTESPREESEALEKIKKIDRELEELTGVVPR